MTSTYKGLVLVTGGSGFIGSWCIARLLQAGWQVRATLLPHEPADQIRAGLAQAVELGDHLSFVIANLDSDQGWSEAMAGVSYVQHIAFPVPQVMPKQAQPLIDAAVSGTLRVLRVARDSGVKRVVLTSSTAAIAERNAHPPSYIYTEADWLNPNRPELSTPYSQAKVRAELAARHWIETQGQGLELVTVNPTWTLGPMLQPTLPASLQVIQKLLRGDLRWGCPQLGWTLTDVRDIADLHLLAMTSPTAAGERFIGGTQWLWMDEMAAILRRELGSDARRVPQVLLPNALMRVLSFFDPVVRSVIPDLGLQTNFSSAKAGSVLHWQPRNIETTIADTAHSLLSYKFV
jgi:dihydroflavonol-4-reductase